MAKTLNISLDVKATDQVTGADVDRFIHEPGPLTWTFANHGQKIVAPGDVYSEWQDSSNVLASPGSLETLVAMFVRAASGSQSSPRGVRVAVGGYANAVVGAHTVPDPSGAVALTNVRERGYRIAHSALDLTNGMAVVAVNAVAHPVPAINREVVAGDILAVWTAGATDADRLHHVRVLSVDSASQVTLSANWAGATLTSDHVWRIDGGWRIDDMLALTMPGNWDGKLWFSGNGSDTAAVEILVAQRPA